LPDDTRDFLARDDESLALELCTQAPVKIDALLF